MVRSVCGAMGAVLLASTALCFNLDSSLMQHLADPTAQQGAYFGYSMAFYRDDQDRARLIVSAPRYDRVSHCPRTRNQGRVFNCDVTGADSIAHYVNCQEFPFDEGCGENINVGGWRGNKTNMWFGVSIAVAKEGRSPIVVCGHRQVAVLAGVSEENREHIIMMGSCVRKPRDQRSFSHSGTELPGYVSSEGYIDHTQLGMSSTYLKEESKFLLGLPGNNYKAGGKTEYSPDSNQYSARWQASDVAHGYHGYAVTSGRFTGSDRELKILGAPRYRSRGRVTVLRNGVMESSIETDKMGIYFGASLAACDLNDDGFDELLVGAPLATTRTGDEGRVFVYKYLNGAFNLTTTLEGEFPGGRFGSAIECAGDLDRDGFNDVIVGSPYANRSRGTVHVYNGGTSGLNTSPSQVIPAPENVTSFGSSLSSLPRVSRFSYPGVGVGAYQSDSAYLLLARPVVRLNVELRLPSSLDLRNGACVFKNDSCGKLQLSMRYTGVGVPDNIGIKYEVHLDTGKLVSRLHTTSRTMLAAVANLSINTPWTMDTDLYLPEQPRDLIAPIVVKVTESLVESPDVARSRTILAPYNKTETQTTFKILCESSDCEYAITTNATLEAQNKEDYVTYKDTRPYKLTVSAVNMGDVILYPEMRTRLPVGVSFGSVKVSDGPRGSTCTADNYFISCNFGSVLLPGRNVTVDTVLMVGDVLTEVTITSMFTSGAIIDNNENVTASVTKEVRVNADIEIYGNFRSSDIFISTSDENADDFFEETLSYRIDNRGPGASHLLRAIYNIRIGMNDTIFAELFNMDPSCGVRMPDVALTTVCSDATGECRNTTSHLFSFPHGQWDRYNNDRDITQIVCNFDEMEPGFIKKGVVQMKFNRRQLSRILPDTGTMWVEVEAWVIRRQWPLYPQPFVASWPLQTRLRIRQAPKAVEVKNFPWILLGAIGGGLLLLILAVLLLWRLGFFKRGVKEDLKRLKRQTMMDYDTLNNSATESDNGVLKNPADLGEEHKHGATS